MTTVEQATTIVLANKRAFGDETIPLSSSVGRILQEDLLADRDFPPFNRVSMDGIAFQYSCFNDGSRSFKVEGLQAAGAPQMTLQESCHCLEVMTGAMLPLGVDTVVRYEDVKMTNGVAIIQVDKVKPGQNIHRKGTDRTKGALIIPAGQQISPAEIGVAATIGKAVLAVKQLPKVAIISTGDELVEVTEHPLPHQIRKSNVHKLAASVLEKGIRADLFHLPDEKAAIRKVLSSLLDSHDALILSGGVSAGKLDFIPDILEELKVEKLFHKVAERPGKPFWFGCSAEAVVFALPGNPVSSFMCLNRYFFPWLNASLGLPALSEKYAALGTDFHFKPDLTYFLQVKIRYGKDGKMTGFPVEGKGSGDLANLVDADAFMELPRGRNDFSAGEVFPIYFYR